MLRIWGKSLNINLISIWKKKIYIYIYIYIVKEFEQETQYKI